MTTCSRILMVNIISCQRASKFQRWTRSLKPLYLFIMPPSKATTGHKPGGYQGRSMCYSTSQEMSSDNGWLPLQQAARLCPLLLFCLARRMLQWQHLLLQRVTTDIFHFIRLSIGSQTALQIKSTVTQSQGEILLITGRISSLPPRWGPRIPRGGILDSWL